MPYGPKNLHKSFLRSSGQCIQNLAPVVKSAVTFLMLGFFTSLIPRVSPLPGHSPHLWGKTMIGALCRPISPLPLQDKTGCIQFTGTLLLYDLSHLMTKQTKWSVCPAKTQINLAIRPVWSESLLCAQWVAKDPSFLHADSENSDQTGQMPFCWFCHEVAHLLIVDFSNRQAVFSFHRYPPSLSPRVHRKTPAHSPHWPWQDHYLQTKRFEQLK